MNDELKKLRDEASATIARIDKALAGMAEKAIRERPFRRGETVLVCDDERYKFMGFFVASKGSRFVVSNNADLLHPMTYPHCEHLPTFIAWDLIDEYYGWAAEYDSGLVTPWSISPEVGCESNSGTIVAVYKRPEARK